MQGGTGFYPQQKINQLTNQPKTQKNQPTKPPKNLPPKKTKCKQTIKSLESSSSSAPFFAEKETEARPALSHVHVLLKGWHAFSMEILCIF
jgi:hypothetical protein